MEIYPSVVTWYKNVRLIEAWGHDGLSNQLGSRVLIVSNGHGEDSLGVVFGQALIDRGLRVDAFPVVGEGQSYHKASIPVVGVQQTMPSGGFLRQGIKPLAMDIRAGFIAMTRRQIHFLKGLESEYDWAVAMGDIYPLWLCGTHLQLPFVFFPTAKSDYIRPHNRLELSWMRRWPRAVFPRDAKTAAGLETEGIQAVYLGNLMMDALKTSGRPLEQDGPLVAVLPGSRTEAYENARMLIRAAEHLPSHYRYAVALAGELSENDLAERMERHGWTWRGAESDDSGLCGYLQWERVTVSLYKGRFADILNAATVVLGMAGTANEQAVGLGKPVITCPGQGPQFTRKFLAAQRKLLGDSVLATDSSPQALAQGVETVMNDRTLYAHMAAVGRERMGEPGGAERIAEYCLELNL